MEFKAKDWVLVRDDEAQKWKLDIFSHYCNDGSSYPYICIGDYYDKCIPYEGNEALLGTTDAPGKEDGWKVGDKVEVLCVDDEKWYDGKIIKINTERDRGFFYYVNAKCFFPECKWCKADQLREPVEKNADEDWNVGDIVEVKNEHDGCWYPGKILLIKKGVMPYFVQSEFGFKESSRLTRCRWCAEEQIRKIGETPEPKEEEEFKFGDKVEANINGKWCEAIFLKNDGSCVPYYVAATDGGTWWCEAEDVRRA